MSLRRCKLCVQQMENSHSIPKAAHQNRKNYCAVEGNEVIGSLNDLVPNVTGEIKAMFWKLTDLKWPLNPDVFQESYFSSKVALQVFGVTVLTASEEALTQVPSPHIHKLLKESGHLNLFLRLQHIHTFLFLLAEGCHIGYKGLLRETEKLQCLLAVHINFSGSRIKGGKEIQNSAFSVF